jgi:hypothetical protein
VKLGDQQRLFTKLVGELIAWAYSQPGMQLTFGEAWRSPEQAALNAKTGAGIANSLHTQRLAVDLNLFLAGQFRTDVASYRPLGERWKTLDPLCRWGGDFSRPDADHFSMEWQGVR